jgi:hypothetical protein
MVLRDAAGLVVDSLNYGLLVDPWAAEGYQGRSGAGQAGCRVPTPGAPGGFGQAPAGQSLLNRSAGRFADGVDTDSNCTDFVLQRATTLATDAAVGAKNVKVANVADFVAGQTVTIDAGAEQESAVIAEVGSAGATTVSTATAAGETVLPVARVFGFSVGQAIVVDSGANAEKAVISAVGGGRGGARITVSAPLGFAHAAGVSVSGTGITLVSPLGKGHVSGASVASEFPTPGSANRYGERRQ